MLHASGQVVARDQVCRIKRGLRARSLPRNALWLGMSTVKMRTDDIVGDGAMVRAIKGQRPHKQGTNIHLRRGSMIQGCTRWFDPRFNARLAYRPANLPPSSTLPPSTECRRPESRLRRSMLKLSRVSGCVRALHASLHLSPFPAGTAVYSRYCFCHLLAQS